MLGILAKSAGGQKALPECQCVKLEWLEVAEIGGSGGMRMTTTNLTTTVSMDIPATFGNLNTIVPVIVNVRRLHAVVAATPGAEIKLSVLPDKLLVYGDGASGHTALAAQNADGFPQTRDPEEQAATVTGQTLREIGSKVVFAASKEDDRPVLQGVCIGQDMAAATDGYRMATLMVHWKSPASVIIPAAALELCAVVFGEDERVDVLISENVVRFQGEHAWVQSQLIEGKFPDLAAVMPRTIALKLRLSQDEMKATLKQISASVGTRVLNLELVDTRETLLLPDGGRRLELSAEDDMNSASFDLPYTFDGLIETGKVKWACNLDFLMDGVSQCGGQVEIQFNAANAPFVITEAGTGWKCVVMPMHMEKQEVKHE